MKNLNISMLCLALPFVIGCSTVNATTPAKSWGGAMNKKELKVESFSQLDSASKEVRPPWLTTTPERIDGYYFVGMSSKRTERRDARNESFNDALIGFARFCGLNVQYLAEHRDKSLGGNGGLIDTWTEGSTIAKMQANMHLGNVTTEDRYTEKYSSFYGGSFMGHTYVDASLVFVPIEEMELCREHTQTANTFIKEKATEVNTLTAKNDSLESENKLLKRQNTNLASVAINQANNSAEFFKQAGYSNKKQPVKRVVTKRKVVKHKPVFVEPAKFLIAKSDYPKTGYVNLHAKSKNTHAKNKKEIVANNIGKNVGKIVSKTKNKNKNTCKIICDGLVAYYPFNGDAIDESGNGNNGRIFGAELTYDRNGNQNQAYRFTGKRNSYIKIPNLGVESGDFTIATIVKANKKPTIFPRNRNFFDSGIVWATPRRSYVGLRYHFYNDGQQAFWVVAGPRPQKDDFYAHVKNPLQYKFLTGVVNQSEKTVSVYVDGNLIRKQRWNGSINGSLIKSWIIGGRGPVTNRQHKGFDGDIDEVRIYNRALGAGEIQHLYHGASTELALNN